MTSNLIILGIALIITALSFYRLRAEPVGVRGLTAVAFISLACALAPFGVHSSLWPLIISGFAFTALAVIDIIREKSRQQ